MRSDRPTSSGTSVEWKRTILPSLARARTSAKISCFAPTSTPRAGSSSRITPGLISSHLPITTFCWLPPERWCTCAHGDGALIRSASIWRLAARASSPRPARAAPAERARRAPARCSARSCARASGPGAGGRTERGSRRVAPTASPRPAGPRPSGNVTDPRIALRTPKSAPSRSETPEPWMPARPTISPACASKLTSLRLGRTARLDDRDARCRRFGPAERPAAVRVERILVTPEHRAHDIRDRQPGAGAREHVRCRCA